VPFDMLAGEVADAMGSRSTTVRLRGGLRETLLGHGGALSLGLASSFVVLLMSRQASVAAPGLCALAAMVVIGLWLGTAGFRRDGTAFAVSSTLCLLPVALIECGWVEVPSAGLALIVETGCLGLLFAGSLRRLGAECTFSARFQHLRVAR